MTSGTGIAVAAIWLSTGGVTCYFREEISPFAVVVMFAIAACATYGLH